MTESVIIGTATLYLGDCLDVLKNLPADSVDSIVTDPPYGLAFMGKRWDYDVPSVEIWAECLRVLKPGGHLLAFAGTRTYHRMTVRIEDAGFEIRDMVAWVYGSGFPKSLDISKALDRMAGAEREVVTRMDRRSAYDNYCRTSNGNNGISQCDGRQTINAITAPATPAAQQWAGWGTALKPAHEPICLARKPLAGTVAENVLAHGVGGLNVDGCRVGIDDWDSQAMQRCNTPGSGQYKSSNHYGERVYAGGYAGQEKPHNTTAGRWPANVIHDGSDEVVGLFPETGPSSVGVRDPNGTMGYHGGASGLPGILSGYKESSCSAARFFYTAKASKADRDEGCEELAARVCDNALARASQLNGEEKTCISNSHLPRRNHHPTVKPIDLMRYLLRLVTPPGGVALDPFMGSGSTGKAAFPEGFHFIGIERDPEYFAIATRRIRAAQRQPDMFTHAEHATRPDPAPPKPEQQTLNLSDA